jgi:hypothetical protein
MAWSAAIPLDPGTCSMGIAALHPSYERVTDSGDGIRANVFYRRHGWQLAGRVDERDVRYEKSRP